MLEISAYLSLSIQFITGIIDLYGLMINVPFDKIIFRDLLKIELGVQSVEFIFYIWMVLNLNRIKNITPYRYLDWFITTPIMLITFMAYLDNNKYINIQDFLKNNSEIIKKVIFLNFLMLLFGFLGEIRILPYIFSMVIGFIPFLLYFKIIYDKYMKEEFFQITQDKKNVFYFFLIVWTLYGIATFTNYKIKNTMYNILDLFSKNGFGLFLVYILWKNMIQSKKE